jgi:hypothetical protein
MNFLKTAVTGLFKAIHDLFTSPAAQQIAERALAQAGQIATQIYPVVEQIAAATPNRTDDQIIACINSYGLMGLVDPTMSDKASVLHNIALAVVQKLMPGVGSSVASLAIEAAYQAVKANAQPKAA